MGRFWRKPREKVGGQTLFHKTPEPLWLFSSQTVQCRGWRDSCLPRFAGEAGEAIYPAGHAKRILIHIISKESRKKLARVSRPPSRQPFIVPNSPFNFCDRVIQSLRP